MLYLINKLLSIVSSDFYCFSLKKTHLDLVYNAEIMASEIRVIDLELYGEHRLEERITGSKTDLDLSAGSTYTRVYGYIICYIYGSIHAKWNTLVRWHYVTTSL